MSEKSSNPYSDRARLAVMLAKLAIKYGFGEAGRTFDQEMADAGYIPDWGHGLLIQLATGEQPPRHADRYLRPVRRATVPDGGKAT